MHTWFRRKVRGIAARCIPIAVLPLTTTPPVLRVLGHRQESDANRGLNAITAT
jgi:hypothetical protein